MKLTEITEGDVIPFFRPSQATPQNDDVKGCRLSDIHDALGIEPAEDELQELEHFYNKAVANFRGKQSVLGQAKWFWNQSWNQYQDARDDEDFDTMDEAFDNMVKSIRMIGGDVPT